MNLTVVRGTPTDNELVALVAVLTNVQKQQPDPLRNWRRKRRQALRMQRGA